MADVLRGWKLALIWVLSLMAVGALTAAAQGQRGRPTNPDPLTLETPSILAGGDIGFRLERIRDGIPIGRLVVRIDGRWVEPQAP